MQSLRLLSSVDNKRRWTISGSTVLVQLGLSDLLGNHIVGFLMTWLKYFIVHNRDIQNFVVFVVLFAANIICRDVLHIPISFFFFSYSDRAKNPGSSTSAMGLSVSCSRTQVRKLALCHYITAFKVAFRVPRLQVCAHSNPNVKILIYIERFLHWYVFMV